MYDNTTNTLYGHKSQTQTVWPAATINQLRMKNIIKISLAFQPIMQLLCASRFRILRNIPNIYFIKKNPYSPNIWPSLTKTTLRTDKQTDRPIQWKCKET